MICAPVNCIKVPPFLLSKKRSCLRSRNQRRERRIQCFRGTTLLYRTRFVETGPRPLRASSNAHSDNGENRAHLSRETPGSAASSRGIRRRFPRRLPPPGGSLHREASVAGPFHSLYRRFFDLLSIIHKKGPAVNACFSAPAPPKTGNPASCLAGKKKRVLCTTLPVLRREGKLSFLLYPEVFPYFA